MNNIEKILKFAMRMEKEAEDFYNYYMDKVTSSELKKVFSELADIENEHYMVLKEKYDQMSVSEPPIDISWVVDNSSSRKGPHILADSTDILDDKGNDTSDLMIIRMAYLIENDFAEFYKNGIEIVDDPDAKGFLKTLHEWENSHKEYFYDRYQKLLKKNWEDISSIIFTK